MEAVGVVLAAFPLVLQGLTKYASAVSTVKELVGPARSLSRYARNIEREETIFSDTLTQFLETIVESDAELEKLMECPGGEAWIQPERETKMKNSLGRSYQIYLDTILDIREALDDIKSEFPIQYSSALKLPASPRLRLSWIKRFRIVFKKEVYEECIKRIKDANSFLRETTNRAAFLEDERERRRGGLQGHAKHIEQQRAHLKSLHRLIGGKVGWPCSYLTQHSVLMHLDGLKSALLQPFGCNVLQITVKVCGNSSHELEIESEKREVKIQNHNAKEVHSSPPTPRQTSQDQNSIAAANSKRRKVAFAAYTKPIAISANRQHSSIQIRDICHAIEDKASCRGTPSSIGFLCPGVGPGFRHHVFYKKQLSSGERDLQTLEALLLANGRTRSRFDQPFSARARMNAAAQLALGVLLLEGSWLTHQSRLKDFALSGGTCSTMTAAGTIVLQDKVVLVCDVGSEFQPSEQDLKLRAALTAHRVPSEILFALAFTLIKLSEGGPMDDLSLDGDVDELQVLAQKKRISSLLASVADESGEEYGKVVRRCLDCPFDSPNPSFDDPNFQFWVFDSIVKPLLEISDQFHSGCRPPSPPRPDSWMKTTKWNGNEWKTNCSSEESVPAVKWDEIPENREYKEKTTLVCNRPKVRI